jgi:fructosamine-3-kinase
VIVAGLALSHARPVGGGDICTAYRAQTADGRAVFAKTRNDAPPAFFTTEADRLTRLRGLGAVPVPEVVAAGPDGLVLEWVEPGAPDGAAAVRFGRGLAALHAETAPAFGYDGDGFVGLLPLDNSRDEAWKSFFVERRLLPYVGSLSADERRDVDAVIARIDELAGPAEPPSLLHGDLWSGNLLWAADGTVRLVDAAAVHFGHRESDLAMLALFGTPYLEEVLSAYRSVRPLADGWRARVALHQLHLLLVHAAMFGGGWGSRAAAAARTAFAAG